MLELTGQFNGEHLQEKVVSWEDFMKLFGKTPPKSGIVKTMFTKVPSKGRESYGSPMVAKTRTIMYEFTGRFNGHQIKVRYYEQKGQRSLKGGIPLDRYFPRKYHLEHGRELTFSEMPEICAFLMATPQGSGSPVQAAARHIFKIDLPEERAKKKTESMLELAKVVNEVDGMDEHVLRVIAQGIRVNGNAFREYRDSMTIDELKAGILDLAASNQSAFIKEWHDPRTKMRGNVQQLISKGFIIPEQHGETKVVKWANKYGGAEITRYSGSKSLVDGIMEHIMVPANSKSFLTMMESVLEEESQLSVASTDAFNKITEKITTKTGRVSKTLMSVNKVSVEDLDHNALLKYARDNDLIYVDHRLKQVFFMMDGEVTEDVYFTPIGKNLNKELENFVAAKENFERLRNWCKN